MAALVSSAVSYYPATGPSATVSRPAWWYPAGKGSREIVSKSLLLVLTGQGGATNTIGAAALGFTTLLDCSNLIDSTNSKLYLASVDPVNNVILLAATAADTYADITTTAAYITVTGTAGAPTA